MRWFGAPNPTRKEAMPPAAFQTRLSRSLLKMLGFAGILTLAFAMGCGESIPEADSQEAVPTTCNPVAAEWDCLFPYPSNYFRTSDSTMPGGHRVMVPDVALPTTTRGTLINFHAESPADGFSFLPQISVHIPDGVAETGMALGPDQGGDSLKLAHPTLILDAETAEPIAHFVEVRVTGSPSFTLLALRPLFPLEPAHRYVVALKNLQTPDGDAIGAPKVFQNLRDDGADIEEISENLRARYQTEIFPVVDDAGLSRKDLLLAWDFTTRTEENVMDDAMTMRSAAMTYFEANPPEVEILGQEENPEELVARRITGTVTAPLFLEHEEPGARMLRDDQGRPMYNSTAKVPFTLQIPHSVMESDSPAPILQFGHGFFQSQSEIHGDAVRTISSENRLVVMAADWWGLSDPDMVPMLDTIARDPQAGLGFVDRIHQAFINFMALTYAAKGALLQEAALQIDDAPCFDPEEIYYYGLSMGHIFGGSYVALSPHVSRAALVSGGAGFALITAYAQPFKAFDLILGNAIEDAGGSGRFVALGLSVLDKVDALTYARHIRDNTFEGSPAKRAVLQQVGVGDVMVPNVTSHMHARAMGLPMMEPTSRDVYGLTTVPAPISDSAVVEFDFRDPDTGEVPGTVNVHEATRRLDASIKQLDGFFQKDGRIEHTCDGECDPE